MQLKKVHCWEEADGSALNVILHRQCGVPRGWFVGPALPVNGIVDVPYAPKSLNLLASIAIVRAQLVASERSLSLCVIDPDDLWNDAWGGSKRN